MRGAMKAATGVSCGELSLILVTSLITNWQSAVFDARVATLCNYHRVIINMFVSFNIFYIHIKYKASVGT